MVIEVIEKSTRYGPIAINASDRPIVDALSKYGEYAQVEIDFVAQFIADGAVVLDIGGHVGIHACAFVRAARNVKVHSFEAQPQLAQLLIRNAASADGQIEAHRIAIGEKVGSAYIDELTDDPRSNAGALLIRHTRRPGDLDIAVTTIDGQKYKRVDLIRLDIEGHEPEALRGASETIRRCNPVILCNVSTILHASRIIDEISTHQYSIFFLKTPAFNPRNHRKNSKNIFGSAGETALLFVPRSRKAPSRLGAKVLVPVTGVDQLVPHFVAARREDDGADDEAIRAALLAELRAAHQSTEAKARQFASAQLELVQQQDAASLLQIRYENLAGLVSRDHVAARRKGILGRLSRRFGRSQLAKLCRKINRSGLFDRNWYKKNYPDVGASHFEPLVHYILYGAYEGRDPCEAFDTSYYLECNDDVRRWGGNPLLHYIEIGERELRWPNHKFDPAAYLKANPGARRDVSLLRQHLLGGGHKEAARAPYRPQAPKWEVFVALAAEREMRQAPVGSPVVDVIVPVYRGYDDALACLMSVLQGANKTRFELIVIDDASPEPELSKALQRLAAMGLITLLRNERNLGFVATVNRGIELHPDRDVLLLNSDTLVFNDWLDRLRGHCSDGKVGTVTPFTNNGTICSYPKFCEDNPDLQDIPFAEIDSLAAVANRAASVEVPTGVGFCMYVTRSALKAAGLLDVETFGSGYGEENDFCWRVSSHRMKNLHALDVFVFHSGETSFGAGAAQAKRDGYQALVKKHPDYPATVERYIGSDPAKVARARLDLATLIAGSFERVVLCFTHAWGGGVDRHLQDRMRLGKATGEAILCVVPVGNGATFRITNVGSNDGKQNLPHFQLDGDIGELKSILAGLVSRIEVHSTARWGSDVLDLVPRLARALGVHYDFVIHDYVAICPQITLLGESGMYCGEKGVEQCRRCLSTTQETPDLVHPDWKTGGMREITEWRRRYRELLMQADELIAPNQDVIDRISRYLPALSFTLRPHVEPDRPFARQVALPYQGGQLRVVVIGAVGEFKGARVLEECVADASRRALPLQFCIVGFTSSAKLNACPDILITGAYKEEEVFDRLQQVGAHAALLPSVGLETYSYTLSIALEAGLPVFAFDLGATGERLRKLGSRTLLPVEAMCDAQRINDALLDHFGVPRRDRVHAADDLQGEELERVAS